MLTGYSGEDGLFDFERAILYCDYERIRGLSMTSDIVAGFGKIEDLLFRHCEGKEVPLIAQTIVVIENKGYTPDLGKVYKRYGKTIASKESKELVQDFVRYCKDQPVYLYGGLDDEARRCAGKIFDEIYHEEISAPKAPPPGATPPKTKLRATLESYNNLMDYLQCAFAGWVIDKGKYVALASQAMDNFFARGIIGDKDLFPPELEAQRIEFDRGEVPPKKYVGFIPIFSPMLSSRSMRDRSISSGSATAMPDFHLPPAATSSASAGAGGEVVSQAGPTVSPLILPRTLPSTAEAGAGSSAGEADRVSQLFSEVISRR